MADTFRIPHKIISGRGALEQAAGDFSAIGKKALVVTDKAMVQIGSVGKLTGALEQAGVAYSLFDGVNSEPTDKIVAEGLRCYQQNGCDFFIALGGGSPMDTMKAVAMLAVCGGSPADYMGKTVTTRLPPMAAVPTTAGTGSEATQFTIITDTVTQVKMLLKGPSLLPELAVIDPSFTISAPPAITAATGVDALCHAIEAYTSRKAQPMADVFALSAVKRIFANLQKAYNNGQDTEARHQMSLAALEAGIAFNNASVTIVHGMSRPIGALFHVPHGVSNAMLLETCLGYILDGAEKQFGNIARACGFVPAGACDTDAAKALMEQTSRLLKELSIPTPKEFGIDKEEFFSVIPKMAADAAASGSPANTRKKITVGAMEELYRKLWE